jgi:hypothetical protein
MTPTLINMLLEYMASFVVMCQGSDVLSTFKFLAPPSPNKSRSNIFFCLTCTNMYIISRYFLYIYISVFKLMWVGLIHQTVNLIKKVYGDV